MSKRKVMSEQGIFNFVWRFMEKQGEPSKADGQCRYRVRRDGRMLACAAGCLLSDAEANSLPQARWDLFDARQQPLRFLPFNDLIQQLQNAHDSAAAPYEPANFVKRFQIRARQVAKEFGLTVPTDTQE